METEMWAEQREKNREKERQGELISTNYTPKTTHTTPRLQQITARGL